MQIQGLLSADDLKTIPFLVLGNKIDIPKAASEAELRQALGLHQTTGKVRLSCETVDLEMQGVEMNSR